MLGAAIFGQGPVDASRVSVTHTTPVGRGGRRVVTRLRIPGKPNPAGSKLARKAAEGRIAVKHLGMRVSGVTV